MLARSLWGAPLARVEMSKAANASYGGIISLASDWPAASRVLRADPPWSTDPLPFPAASFVVIDAAGAGVNVDMVVASPQEGALVEWSRILARGGVLRLPVPTAGNRLAGSQGAEVLSDGHLRKLESALRAKDLHPIACDSGVLTARRGILTPHAVDLPLTAREFAARRGLRSSIPATFVVPVRDEAENLPKFFSFLENASHDATEAREFVVVLNGCTDTSAEVARRCAAGTELDVRLVESEPGIVPALRAGIAARRLDGYVGKLDADVIIHPYALDLMHYRLDAHPDVFVTYSEPVPIDAAQSYNRPEHNPAELSRRLYFNGKASLYRSDPFVLPGVASVADDLRAEDVFLSFYLTYFHGLESIDRTPHAIVYHKTIGSYQDLVAMISRTRSEIGRILRRIPEFGVLDQVLAQEAAPGEYRALLERAETEARYVDDWTRLVTTK